MFCTISKFSHFTVQFSFKIIKQIDFWIVITCPLFVQLFDCILTQNLIFYLIFHLTSLFFMSVYSNFYCMNVFIIFFPP